MELLLGIGTGGIQGGQPIPVQFAAGLLAVWALLFLKNKSLSKIVTAGEQG